MTGSSTQPKRMTRDEYRDVYLRSDHWRETRLAALERAEHRCQVCNRDGSLDVHHRTYERLGEERPADLTVLCRACHSLFHGEDAPRQQKVRKPKAKRPRKRYGELTVSEKEELGRRILATIKRLDNVTNAVLVHQLNRRSSIVNAAVTHLYCQRFIRKDGKRWRLTPRGEAAVM